MSDNNLVSNPKAGNGLNIAGLVLGILGLLLSFIPCTIFFGAPLAVIGLILAFIGFNQAKKGGASTGMGIAALALCGLAIVISSYWAYKFYEASKNPEFKNAIEKAKRDFKDSLNAR